MMLIDSHHDSPWAAGIGMETPACVLCFALFFWVLNGCPAFWRK